MACLSVCRVLCAGRPRETTDTVRQREQSTRVLLHASYIIALVLVQAVQAERMGREHGGDPGGGGQK